MSLVSLRGVACAAALLLLAGCGRSDREPVFPARGRLLYDGKPATHALVVFHPLNQPAGKGPPRPSGRVAEDGSFVLTTYETGDGAPAGDYAVTVEWWLSPAATSKGPDAGDSPPVNRLPAHYAQVQTSGLRARIGPGENDLPELRLTRK